MGSSPQLNVNSGSSSNCKKAPRLMPRASGVAQNHLRPRVYKAPLTHPVPCKMPYRKRTRSMRRSRRTRRGKYARRDRTGSTRRLVNQILNKKTETKYYDLGVQDQNMYHNLGWGTVSIPPTTFSSIPTWFNPWINILKGDERFNRIGDKIMPRGMSIRMYFQNNPDHPNIAWRVVVAILPKVFNGQIVTSQFSNTFQIPNTGISNITHLLPADKDAGVKFLYDRIVRPHNSYVAARASGGLTIPPNHFMSLWIKRKRAGPIIYDTTNSTLVNRPLAVFCIPYSTFATSQLSNIGQVTGFMRMYYKDF